MTEIIQSLTRGLKMHGPEIVEYSDWLKFVQRLNEALDSGRIRRVPVLKPVWSTIGDEEWFLDDETGDVYVYSGPNPPSLPIWKRIDVLAHLAAPDPSPLTAFKVGAISPMMAHIFKMKLRDYESRGLVTELQTPLGVADSKTERWFRDNTSDVVYRLIERYSLGEKDQVFWEVVPYSEKGHIQ